MPRFFIEKPISNYYVITGNDAVHISKSLRMHPGDDITLSSSGTDYIAKITSVSNTEVKCNIISSSPSVNEPNISLTLFQALPKSDKMDFIIQKATELGVSRIVPILTDRCVSRPDNKSMPKKIIRWQKIALEAAKQSGRAVIPQVSELMNFNECIMEAKKLDKTFFCYENGGKRLTADSFSNESNIGVIIGSEGGFALSEASLAENNGLIITSLGKRILRCETAPIAVTSIIMSLTGNM